MTSLTKHALTLRVPENVVPCLQRVLPAKEFKKNLHYYLWPVHLICEKQASNTDAVFNQNDGFVFLHSKNDIECVVGGSKPVLRILKAAGIIYCKKSLKGNERYFANDEEGGTSETKLYAIDEKYMYDSIIEYVVRHKEYVERVNSLCNKGKYEPKTKLEKCLKKAFKEFELHPYTKTYCELKKSLTMLGKAVSDAGTTDHEQLHKVLPKIIKAVEDNGHTVKQVLHELSCIAPYKKGRYATDLLQIKQLESGDIFFLRAEKGNRIFTTANQLPRDIRRFIQHKAGATLFEADIRNCQPLMLCGLLKERYKKNWPTDALLYKELCERGQFYEYMYKAIHNVMLNEREEDERTDFKKKLFGRVYYCKVPKSIDNNVYAKAFEREFPSVYDFIITYKVKYGYKALSTDMQGVESRLVIDNVCSQLMKTKCAVLTIHDGIIVTGSEIGRTEELLQAAFDKKLKLSPEVKRKQIELHDIELYKRFDYLIGQV